MTPRIDLTPWQPQRVIGFAGTWTPISGAEAAAVVSCDTAIIRAMVTSARDNDRQRGARRG